MEATLHLDVLSLFWNIWSNPNTKTFEVLRYLLAMADKNSLTWSAHVRILFQIHSLFLTVHPGPKNVGKVTQMQLSPVITRLTGVAGLQLISNSDILI